MIVKLTQPINDVIDKMDFIDDIDVVEVGSPASPQNSEPMHIFTHWEKLFVFIIRHQTGKA